MARWATVGAAISAAIGVSASSLARTAQAVGRRWGSTIRPLLGHVPEGLALVRVAVESGGSPSRVAVNKIRGERLYEIGLLQMWEYQARELDVDPCDPRGNLWGMLRVYNQRARALRAAHVALFPQPDGDFWAMAHLTMTIGDSAVAALLDAAKPAAGRVWPDVCKWIDAHKKWLMTAEAAPLRARFGSQTPPLVAYRVYYAGAVIRAAGMISPVSSSGFGQLVPRPASLPRKPMGDFRGVCPWGRGSLPTTDGTWGPLIAAATGFGAALLTLTGFLARDRWQKSS